MDDFDRTILRLAGCVVGAAALVVGSCSLVKFGGIYNGYSEGTRVGVLQTFSVRGVIYKSGEGTLLMQGFRTEKSGDSTVIVNNSFEFSAIDTKTQDDLNATLGKTVKLHYRQWWMAPWSQSTEYTIVKVEAE